MKNTVKTQVRIQTMLPRVEDLEHSVQWTSLASDIDHLERLRRHDWSHRFRKPEAVERHAYQRAVVPEMQRASTIKCDDNHDDTRRSLTTDYSEGSRWSWKPRTDFEREYFYKDYKDYYCSADPAKCLEPALCESLRQSCRRDRDCYSRDRGYPRHPSESPAGRSSGRYDGLDKEHFSDSRERLHEIFEHNRYLRRQFFASGNARQDCAGFPRHLGRSQQEAPRRYNGFGSTETLTSQSNQSSVSSINDRKSRWGQTSRSPEEEEEDALAALTIGNNAPRAKLRVHERRIDRGGNDDGSREDCKVLVNILPGNEVRHVDVRSAPVKPNEASHEGNDGGGSSSLVEESRFRTPTSDQGALDKSHRANMAATSVANYAAWRRERSLPEYIFGESAKSDFKAPGDLGNSLDVYDRNGARTNDLEWRSNAKDQPALSEFRRQVRDEFARAHGETRSRTISEDRRLDSIPADVSETNASVDQETCWDLSRSLPNLTISKRNLDAPLYVARAVNVPEESPVESPEPSDYKLDDHIAIANLDSRRKEQSGHHEERNEGRTRSISCGQSISEATDEPVSPKRLTPRKVKAPRVPPPPLDLTMVNELCERMMAEERKCLNDYSVDVAILRSQEDLVRDLLATVGHEEVVVDVVKDDTLSKIEDGSLGQAYKRNDKKKRSFRPLHKSCGDLSLADELQSPQLVNNCKSSTCDLRTVDPAVRIARRPIDPDASRHDRATSPLFDQTGPIGGLHAGSALPSVYGPIPYSQ